jgi:plastocyanin
MTYCFDKLIIFRAILITSLFLMVPLIILFGASCQSQAPPESSPGLIEETNPGESPMTSPHVEVTMEGFAFKPAEITIVVGTTVTWHNEDSAIHTVTDRNKLFESGNLSRGNTFSYTFEQKGTFEYYCITHPYMNGKVIVE